MFCSFSQKPLVLSLYGTVHVYQKRDYAFIENKHNFKIMSTKQNLKMNMKSVQPHYGFAEPFMDFKK